MDPNLAAISPHWSFPFCPQPPSWSLDWTGIMSAFHCVAAMGGCAQDSEFHGEGDVLAHTRMVCDKLVEMNCWRNLSAGERSVLFGAALLHDVAKPICTRMENGRLTSPRHAVRGAQMARLILWRDMADRVPPESFACREAITSLVRYHSRPMHMIRAADPVRQLLEVSQRVRCDLLAILAEADALGRECPEKSELIEKKPVPRIPCTGTCDPPDSESHGNPGFNGGA